MRYISHLAFGSSTPLPKKNVWKRQALENGHKRREVLASLGKGWRKLSCTHKCGISPLLSTVGNHLEIDRVVHHLLWEHLAWILNQCCLLVDISACGVGLP